MVQQTTEKIKMVQEKLRKTQSRQKSYANKKRQTSWNSKKGIMYSWKLHQWQRLAWQSHEIKENHSSIHWSLSNSHKNRLCCLPNFFTFLSRRCLGCKSETTFAPYESLCKKKKAIGTVRLVLTISNSGDVFIATGSKWIPRVLCQLSSNRDWRYGAAELCVRFPCFAVEGYPNIPWQRSGLKQRLFCHE